MNTIKSELRYITKVGILAGLLTLAFFTILIVHEHLFKSKIIFYGYTKILFFSFAAMIIILFVLRRYVKFFRLKLRISDIIISSCFSMLLSFTIYFVFPVNVERSFSVFMIGSLNKYEEPVPAAEFEQIVSRYFHGQKMVEKRINEQLATKSIEINWGGGIGKLQLKKRRRVVGESF
jgi:hypothetical protein